MLHVIGHHSLSQRFHTFFPLYLVPWLRFLPRFIPHNVRLPAGSRVATEMTSFIRADVALCSKELLCLFVPIAGR